jgi:type II secretory pathway component GspD/PulD (secretin)
MILDLTPRITDSGIITLDLALTISEAGAGSEATLPLIRERSTSTTLWARDGQTLITGGLIEETESENDQGIPFLMDIPILGYLFKTTGVKKSRTELLLMFTPHIIRDLDEADRVVEEFTRSVNRLKTDMDSRSGWAGRALETQP